MQLLKSINPQMGIFSRTILHFLHGLSEDILFQTIAMQKDNMLVGKTRDQGQDAHQLPWSPPVRSLIVSLRSLSLAVEQCQSISL